MFFVIYVFITRLDINIITTYPKKNNTDETIAIFLLNENFFFILILHISLFFLLQNKFNHIISCFHSFCIIFCFFIILFCIVNKECAKHIRAPLLRRIFATFFLGKSVCMPAQRFYIIGNFKEISYDIKNAEIQQKISAHKKSLVIIYLPTLALSKSGSGLKHSLTLSPPTRAPRL